MNRTTGLLSLSAVFAMVMLFGFSSQALAGMPPHPPHPHPPHPPHPGWHHHHHHHHGFGLGFSIAPRPSGYYTTVTETVMVAPERVEQYWVPAEFTTVTNSDGTTQQVKVRDGYMASRVIPAQYTTVTRQVWVPSGGPSFGVGLGFRF